MKPQNICVISYGLVQLFLAVVICGMMILMIRDLSMASALGSVLSLERTMLGTFGVTTDSFNIRITAITGFLVFVIFCCWPVI
jgi:hypothetical protein